MGKYQDLTIILVLIVIGVLIPFVGALSYVYGFEPVNIAKTFGVFLLIFGIELGAVILFFYINGKVSTKEMDQYKPDAFKQSEQKVKQKTKK